MWHKVTPTKRNYNGDIIVADVTTIGTVTTVTGTEQQIDSMADMSLKCVVSLAFSNSFNGELRDVHWPATLTRLVFGAKFDQNVDALLPPSLTQVEFGDQFDQAFAVGALPPLLQCVTFGYSFNRSIGGALLALSNLTHVTFGYHFDQPIAFLLPPSVQRLKFVGMFNQPLRGLPPMLTHLTLGHHFDQPLDALAQATLLSVIVFGRKFRQPLDPIANLPLLRCIVVSSNYPTHTIPTALVVNQRD